MYIKKSNSQRIPRLRVPAPQRLCRVISISEAIGHYLKLYIPQPTKRLD
jgi:hypothetical protein